MHRALVGLVQTNLPLSRILRPPHGIRRLHNMISTHLIR